MVSYADLLATLPGSIHLEHGADAHPALAPAKGHPTFQPPTLKHLRGPFGSAPIVLIAAPGAVGKSTLARQIAGERGAWVWDLSKLHLGDNSFVGTIAQSFGPQALGNTLTALVEGRLLMVFDAFDEAEVLSGWNRIEAFVGEVWGFAKGAPAPVVVMLARTATAQLLEITLEDLGGPGCFTLLEIDFFDETSARGLLAGEVAGRGSNVHLSHPGPFKSAVSTIFAAIGRGVGVSEDRLWEESISRSFLGYAPVLQTIASYLAEVANPQTVVQSFAAGTPEQQGQRLLNQLMFELLQREQGKLIEALKAKALPEASGWTGWVRLYRPIEQLERVFSMVSAASGSRDSTPQDVPGWLLAEYRAGVASLLENHPFLRERQFAGPAFRDYTVGYLVRASGLARDVERYLDRGEFALTPLFCFFYAEAADGAGSGRHAGYLYEAATAQHAVDSFTQTTLVSPAEDGGPHVLDVFVEGPDDVVLNGVTLPLLVGDGHPVTFRGPLRSVHLEVRGPVELGSPGAELEMADAVIACDRLTLRAKSVIARCYQRGDDVVLRAGEYVQLDGTLTVDKRGDGALDVSWPGSDRHPWARYTGGDKSNGEPDRQAALLALRRILTWFRRDRKEDFARFFELIDNVAVGQNPLRQRMLGFLQDRGVLTLRGRLYVLDPERARNAGINWMDLRRGQVTDAMSPILDAFLAWDHGAE